MYFENGGLTANESASKRADNFLLLWLYRFYEFSTKPENEVVSNPETAAL